MTSAPFSKFHGASPHTVERLVKALAQAVDYIEHNEAMRGKHTTAYFRKHVSMLVCGRNTLDEAFVDLTACRELLQEFAALPPLQPKRGELSVRIADFLSLHAKQGGEPAAHIELLQDALRELLP